MAHLASPAFLTVIPAATGVRARSAVPTTPSQQQIYVLLALSHAPLVCQTVPAQVALVSTTSTAGSV